MAWAERGEQIAYGAVVVDRDRPRPPYRLVEAAGRIAILADPMHGSANTIEFKDAARNRQAHDVADRGQSHVCPNHRRQRRRGPGRSTVRERQCATCRPVIDRRNRRRLAATVAGAVGIEIHSDLAIPWTGRAVDPGRPDQAAAPGQLQPRRPAVEAAEHDSGIAQFGQAYGMLQALRSAIDLRARSKSGQYFGRGGHLGLAHVTITKQRRASQIAGFDLVGVAQDQAADPGEPKALGHGVAECSYTRDDCGGLAQAHLAPARQQNMPDEARALGAGQLNARHRSSDLPDFACASAFRSCSSRCHSSQHHSCLMWSRWTAAWQCGAFGAQGQMTTSSPGRNVRPQTRQAWRSSPGIGGASSG